MPRAEPPDMAITRGAQMGLDPDVERVRKLARVLDSYFVDPLIGLVPGVGDLIGSLLGLYVVVVAIQKRMSPVVIARMLLNLALDAGLGLVPVVGDVADVAFKANLKNVALLTTRSERGGKASLRDWLAVVGAILAFAAAIGLVIYALIAVIRRLT